MSWEPLETLREQLLKLPFYTANSTSILHPANWDQQLKALKWVGGFGLLHYIKYRSEVGGIINLEIETCAVQQKGKTNLVSQNGDAYLVSNDEREMFIVSRLIYKSMYPQLQIVADLERLGVECFNKHQDTPGGGSVVIVLWWDKKIIIKDSDLDPLKAILSDPNCDISKFEPLIKAAIK